MIMLTIDNVRYRLWVPDDEEKFAQFVIEHIKDIFGGNSEYFDLKRKIRSRGGIGSIPDGYVITFGKNPRWYVVELEISSHSLYDHMVPQLHKFISGLKNPKSRKRLVEAVYNLIDQDKVRRSIIENKIGSGEVYRFISSLITDHDPTLVIVIDEQTRDLQDICETLSHSLETEVVEFKTFEREGVGLGVRAHLFEPLVAPVVITPIEAPLPTKERRIVEVEVTLGGQRVKVSRDGIMQAANDPRIQNFTYKTKFVEIDGRRYPVKGLVSIATGVPTNRFVTTTAQSILQKLGFRVVEIR